LGEFQHVADFLGRVQQSYVTFYALDRRVGRNEFADSRAVDRMILPWRLPIKSRIASRRTALDSPSMSMPLRSTIVTAPTSRKVAFDDTIQIPSPAEAINAS